MSCRAFFPVVLPLCWTAWQSFLLAHAPNVHTAAGWALTYSERQLPVTWGTGELIFFFFATAEQTQRVCRPFCLWGWVPHSPTLEPLQVQLYSPAGLSHCGKDSDYKERMHAPGGVAKKRNLGGAIRLSIWEPWERCPECWWGAKETTNMVHPWIKIKEHFYFHL